MKNFHKTIKIIFFIIILTSIVFPFAQEVQARKKISDPMYFNPQVGIGTEVQVGVPIKIDEWTFVDYVITIYDWAIKAIVLLAIVMIMYSGFKWMMAGGNASSITKARDQIISALIGLVLAIGSYALLNFINPSLVNFRNLRIVPIQEETLLFACKDCSVDKICLYDQEKSGEELVGECVNGDIKIWIETMKAFGRTWTKDEAVFSLSRDSSKGCGEWELYPNKFYIYCPNNYVCAIPAGHYTKKDPMKLGTSCSGAECVYSTSGGLTPVIEHCSDCTTYDCCFSVKYSLGCTWTIQKCEPSSPF